MKYTLTVATSTELMEKGEKDLKVICIYIHNVPGIDATFTHITVLYSYSWNVKAKIQDMFRAFLETWITVKTQLLYKYIIKVLV